jgi:hypothetical protein
VNLFTNYTREEINYLLSLTKSGSSFKIFNGLSPSEIELILSEKKEFTLHKKKSVIVDRDFLWIKKGEVLLVKEKEITKLKKNMGAFIKGKNYIILGVSESNILMFDIKGHNELTSIFYKNVLDLMVNDKLILKG